MQPPAPAMVGNGAAALMADYSEEMMQDWLDCAEATVKVVLRYYFCYSLLANSKYAPF